MRVAIRNLPRRSGFNRSCRSDAELRWGERRPGDGGTGVVKEHALPFNIPQWKVGVAEVAVVGAIFPVGKGLVEIPGQAGEGLFPGEMAAMREPGQA